MQQLSRILLVEDDRRISGALEQALGVDCHVAVAPTGTAALHRADDAFYDVVLLDLGLPDLPGLAVCQRLRERGFAAPIIVLTANDKTLSKITLLDAGANDYLTKPFSLGELKARMRALTRPPERPARRPAGSLQAGGLELNRQTREVSRNGVPLRLRRKEFALLECLMEHAGSVVSRRVLIRHVWQGAEELWTNTIEVHMKHLRDKVDRPFERPLIRTIYGVGYKLLTESSAAVTKR